VALAEVANLELVLPSRRHGMRRAIDSFAQSRGLELNVSVEMDALAQIKELVARGSGYTILADAAARDRVERGELCSSPIVDPVIVRPIYLVRKLTRPQTYVSREVERITLEVVNDLVARKIWNASQKAGAH
jgi:LysR family transcriptional regulator, nitrogen assimilation regulatory protein